jgi:hypothetical protein
MDATTTTTKEAALRKIVSEHQAAEIEGVLVDATSASMLVQVLDNLNPINKAKFLALDIGRMAHLGWRLVSGH